MSEHEQHKPEGVDIVDRAAAALRDVAVPDGPSEQLLADTLSALRAADERPHLGTANNNNSRRRTFTMRFIAKLAVAAVLAIFVGALVWTAGPLGGHAAFADVLEKVRKVHSVRFKAFTEPDTGPAAGKGVTVLIVGDRMRQELGDGRYVNIIDFKTGQAISLVPKTRQAIHMKVEKAPKAVRAARQQNVLEVFRTMKDSDGKPLGRKEIGGRTLVGYAVDQPGRTMKVWVDPETQLPARIDASIDVPTLPKSDLVMKDFEWDVPVDESAVSLAVPPGYSVEEVKVNGTRATERDLVEGLRVVATVGEGSFPDAFTMEGLVTAMTPKGAKVAGGHPADKQKAFKEMMDKMTPVMRGLFFVHERNGEDFHYAGKGAKLGEAGRPVFWYRPAGSEKYHVIMADLTVKDVAADELPKVKSQKLKEIKGLDVTFGAPASPNSAANP